MADLTRRTFLAAAAVPAVASVPALAASPVGADHPDAALLAAFEDWRRASPIAENLPEAWTEEQREPYWQEVYGALDRMEALPARTPDGIAVKLRYLHAALGETMESYDTILKGQPPTADCLADFRHRLLWKTMQDAERMGTTGT